MIKHILIGKINGAQLLNFLDAILQGIPLDSQLFRRNRSIAVIVNEAAQGIYK